MPNTVKATPFYFLSPLVTAMKIYSFLTKIERLVFREDRQLCFNANDVVDVIDVDKGA